MTEHEHRPREHDHLVEPFFAGLRVPAPEARAPGAGAPSRWRRSLRWSALALVATLVVWLLSAYVSGCV